MHFCHSARIWQDYPQLVPGLLVVDSVHPNVDVEAVIQPLYQQARERLSAGPESQMPQVAAWRRAYSQMGLKPTKYRSAAEALLRRFKRDDDLPRLHPLVDVCNAVSLAFALPVAVFDVAHIDTFIEVRYATGDEEYLAFSGEIEHPAPDEVIFADAANQVHARRWTFRQSRQSTINQNTAKVLIVSEGLHETALADETQLLDVLAEAITQFWTAPKQQVILTSTDPKLEF